MASKSSSDTFERDEGKFLVIHDAQCYLVCDIVLQASCIFLYFHWEGREGEENASGHSGHLFCHEGMLMTMAMLYASAVCVACAQSLPNSRDRRYLQSAPDRCTLSEVVSQVYADAVAFFYSPGE